MSKFTEGTWEVGIIYGDHYTVFANEHVVVDCFSSEANARLIAAAPEMYKILDGLIYKLKANGADEREEIDEAIQEMKSLLARIDGEDK